MYLISLYFDNRSNQILQKYIKKIAEATGNDFMIANQVPPHITISSIEARNADTLIPAFETVTRTLQSGTIQIVSVGQLFPYVMYGSVVMNQYLLDLSEKFYLAYKDIPETTISRYYQPLSWLPHITFGKTLDKKQMLQAFQVMQENFIPVTAAVTKVGLAKVNPHKDLAEFRLPE